ncbi:MAG: hypothetical protein WC774_05375 [Candidatus Gracilibacteria bacterium]
MTEISSLTQKVGIAKHERNENIDIIISQLIKNKTLAKNILDILEHDDDIERYPRLMDGLPDLMTVAKDNEEKALLQKIFTFQELVRVAIFNRRVGIGKEIGEKHNKLKAENDLLNDQIVLLQQAIIDREETIQINQSVQNTLNSIERTMTNDIKETEVVKNLRIQMLEKGKEMYTKLKEENNFLNADIEEIQTEITHRKETISKNQKIQDILSRKHENMVLRAEKAEAQQRELTTKLQSVIHPTVERRASVTEKPVPVAEERRDSIKPEEPIKPDLVGGIFAKFLKPTEDTTPSINKPVGEKPINETNTPPVEREPSLSGKESTDKGILVPTSGVWPILRGGGNNKPTLRKMV